MDYTKLKTIMEKEDMRIEEIFEFFGAKDKREMQEMIANSLKSLKIELNDDLGYISPELIYDFAVVENHNVFYERLMTISFFLRAFAGYNTSVIEAFVTVLGVIKFVFIAEGILKNREEFVFFKESYNTYKQDKYFREQTDRMLSVFDEIQKETENLDLESIKDVLKDFPKK